MNSFVFFHEIGQRFCGFRCDSIVERNPEASYKAVSLDADEIIGFSFLYKVFFHRFIFQVECYIHAASGFFLRMTPVESVTPVNNAINHGSFDFVSFFDGFETAHILDPVEHAVQCVNAENRWRIICGIFFDECIVLKKFRNICPCCGKKVFLYNGQGHSGGAEVFLDAGPDHVEPVEIDVPGQNIRRHIADYRYLYFRKFPVFRTVDGIVGTDMNEEELCKVIGDYDAIITRSQTKVTTKVIDAAKNLKVIGRAGVGIDGIDVAEATKKGITVVNTPESNTIAACEHTIALMLSMTRHIPQAHQSIMEGRWDRKSFTGIQLLNKTVGIIGVGRVGSNVAKRLQAFNMRTIGYDPYIPLERGKQLGVELVDLDSLLKESDYITLHTPLTDETRGMIGKKEIEKMKDGVRIVNASRGAVVDINALADALKSGKVAGAGIDVWPHEPLKPEENPFLGMTNVALTPHLGASTKEAQAGVATDVAIGVMQALHGEPVATAVNASPITKATLHVIQPYFNLCERMGNIAIDLAGGRINRVNVEYTGELADTETAPLTTAVLKGLLAPVLQQTVNFVNARGIAENRHMDVREVKAKKGHYFTNTISLTVDTDKGSHRITGSLFDRKEAKIVSIDHFRVDFEPKGCIIIAPHEDKPGMIGQVASVLGKEHININGMQVGAGKEEGTNVMAVAVDKDIPSAVIPALMNIDGIHDVKVIHCEH